LRPGEAETLRQKGVAKKSCSLHGSQKTERGRNKIYPLKAPPLTYFLIAIQYELNELTN
jgi:hypothetical protein